MSFCCLLLQSEEVLIVNLHDSMCRLIATVLGRYIPISMVKDFKDKLPEIPHTDCSNQLNDLELFIGNEARLTLTSLEEVLPQKQIQEFLGCVDLHIG